MGVEVRRPTVVAAAVLIDEERDLLLMGLRTDSGLWEVPGGKVDDETVEEAACRELKEEVGIEAVSCFVMDGFAEVTDNNGRWFIVFTAVRQWHGEPHIMEPHKCCELRWFPLAELPDNVTLGTAQFFKNILPRYYEP